MCFKRDFPKPCHQPRMPSLLLFWRKSISMGSWELQEPQRRRRVAVHPGCPTLQIKRQRNRSCVRTRGIGNNVRPSLQFGFLHLCSWIWFCPSPLFSMLLLSLCVIPGSSRLKDQLTKPCIEISICWLTWNVTVLVSFHSTETLVLEKEAL